VRATRQPELRVTYGRLSSSTVECRMAGHVPLPQTRLLSWDWPTSQGLC
jgi:hypothetical protein